MVIIVDDNELKKAHIPENRRIYLSGKDPDKIPRDVAIYEGPRGGRYIDSMELTENELEQVEEPTSEEEQISDNEIKLRGKWEKRENEIERIISEQEIELNDKQRDNLKNFMTPIPHPVLKDTNLRLFETRDYEQYAVGMGATDAQAEESDGLHFEGISWNLINVREKDHLNRDYEKWKKDSEKYASKAKEIWKEYGWSLFDDSFHEGEGFQEHNERIREKKEAMEFFLVAYKNIADVPKHVKALWHELGHELWDRADTSIKLNFIRLPTSMKIGDKTNFERKVRICSTYGVGRRTEEWAEHFRYWMYNRELHKMMYPEATKLIEDALISENKAKKKEIGEKVIVIIEDFDNQPTEIEVDYELVDEYLDKRKSVMPFFKDDVVPKENRIYIRAIENPESLPKDLPVYEGPMGGRYIDSRMLREMGVEEEDVVDEGEEPSGKRELDKRIEERRERCRALIEDTYNDIQSVFEDDVITYRLKEADSIKEKMEKKGLDVDDLTDVLGFRVETETLQDLYHSVDKVQNNFNVIEVEEFLDNPKMDYYRGVHVLFEKEGETVELQLRIKGSTPIYEWGHDVLYKPKDKDNENPARNVAKEYLRRLSDYIHGLEDKKPNCPDIIWRLWGCV